MTVQVFSIYHTDKLSSTDRKTRAKQYMKGVLIVEPDFEQYCLSTHCCISLNVTYYNELAYIQHLVCTSTVYNYTYSPVFL